MVYVTGGEFKGRRLTAPPSIRPTEAKVRQAVFNILGSFIGGARVLDGYAGCGALGCEAISRGAAFVAFIEQDPETALAIRENLDRLGADVPRASWRLLQLEFTRGLEELARTQAPFDVVLLDPPYGASEGKKALNALVQCAILAPAGVVVVEHERRTELPAIIGPLQQGSRHRYGDTVLSLYQASKPSHP